MLAFLVKRHGREIALAATLLISGCAAISGGGGSGQGVMSSDEVENFNAAMSLINNDNYSDGIALLNDTFSDSRKSAVPFINLAIAHRKQGELDDAEKNLLIALDIEPENPVANNEYGLLLRRKGQFAEARKTYEDLLKKYPDFALANKNLGVLCDIYLRDYPCALEAYQAYSALTPEDEDVEMWITDLEWRTKQ